MTQSRKTRTRPLTLGEFITCVYDACDEQRAQVIVWLAVRAQLVVFRRRNRSAIFINEIQ